MKMLNFLRRFKQKMCRALSLSPQSKLSRLRSAWSYYASPIKAIWPWLFESREYTNFTYDLLPRNERCLAAFVCLVCGRPHAEIEGYFRELHEDEELRRHIDSVARGADRALGLDPEAHYGRRLGWYAFVRAMKPRTVVETGIDKGLGTCVLASALRRNAAESKLGRVYATDIDPRAGVLLQGVYREFGTILLGDSLESLKKLEGPIDLFINDSDHCADYEMREYETIASKLSPGAVILGDNAHVTTCLLDFSVRTNRSFLFFREEPAKHWYPGGGLGVSFPRRAITP